MARSVLSSAKKGERVTKYGRNRRGANVQLVGIDELAGVLEEMLRSTDDLRGAWTDIYHPALLKGEEAFFDTEGEGKWRGLTERYEMYDYLHGGGGPLLTGTPKRKRYQRPHGHLRASLIEANHPFHIFDVTARWLRTGTRDPLANIFFAKRGRRKRKPMDAKSESMQGALRLGVEEHCRRYAQQWGGTG